MMTAEQLADLINTKCLTEAGRMAPQNTLAVTAKDSPRRAEIEAEIEAVKARWDAEAPVREARAKLASAGWRKSDYQDGVWVKRTKTGTIKRSLVEAIREAGLAQ
jgi:hypothetical protein